MSVVVSRVNSPYDVNILDMRAPDEHLARWLGTFRSSSNMVWAITRRIFSDPRKAHLSANYNVKSDGYTIIAQTARTVSRFLSLPFSEESSLEYNTLLSSITCGSDDATGKVPCVITWDTEFQILMNIMCYHIINWECEDVDVFVGSTIPTTMMHCKNNCYTISHKIVNDLGLFIWRCLDFKLVLIDDRLKCLKRVRIITGGAVYIEMKTFGDTRELYCKALIVDVLSLTFAFDYSDLSGVKYSKRFRTSLLNICETGNNDMDFNADSSSCVCEKRLSRNPRGCSTHDTLDSFIFNIIDGKIRVFVD
jgi:hypothetical protein